MHLDKLSKSNMNTWTLFVTSVSWIHCAQTILYQANILTFWFLVLRRAKTADVLRVPSRDSSQQERGIKGKRNGVIISSVLLFFVFFKSVSTVNVVVTFPLVFSSVNQSVHCKHLLKPVCFIQTAFLNLLYHGIELFISDAWECLFFLFSRKLLHPISVMASRQTVDSQWGS